MSEADRKRWEERYRAGSHRAAADPWVLERLREAPVGRLLDVASGTGALALEAAAMGFFVSAIDISSVALEELGQEAQGRGLTIETHVADLDEAKALDGLGPFDFLSVSRYKPTPSQWQRLADVLVPGGSLFLCSFSERQESMRPAFRLNQGELMTTLEPLGLVLKEWQSFERGGDHMAGSVWVKGAA
ncbi:MAG: class I SAM-dependent methyltransferase [Geminicoccaceae bacterium]